VRLAIAPLPLVAALISVLALAMAMWKTIPPLSVVLSAIRTYLDSLAVEDAVLPLAFVLFAVHPVVDALAVGLIILVLSLIHASISIRFDSLAVLLAIQKRSFVDISVGVGHLARALRYPMDVDVALELVAVLIRFRLFLGSRGHSRVGLLSLAAFLEIAAAALSAPLALLSSYS